jgi:hypothetical protein
MPEVYEDSFIEPKIYSLTRMAQNLILLTIAQIISFTVIEKRKNRANPLNQLLADSYDTKIAISLKEPEVQTGPIVNLKKPHTGIKAPLSHAIKNKIHLVIQTTHLTLTAYLLLNPPLFHPFQQIIAHLQYFITNQISNNLAFPSRNRLLEGHSDCL